MASTVWEEKLLERQKCLVIAKKHKKTYKVSSLVCTIVRICINVVLAEVETM